MKHFTSATLTVLLSTALAAQGADYGSTGRQYDEADPIPLPEIVVDTVSPTFMMDTGLVKVTGSGLNAVSRVSVNGVDAFIQSSSETSILFLAPKLHRPGFASLVLSNRRDAVETTLPYCPTLTAQFPMALTGAAVLYGGQDFTFIEKEPLSVKVAVELGNGAPGYYFISASLGTRARPLRMGPAGYGMFLGNPWTVVAVGKVQDVENLRLTVKVPWEFYLNGDTIFLQGLTQQITPNGTFSCFSNVASVDMGL